MVRVPGASTCITGAYQQYILYGSGLLQCLARPRAGMPMKAACPLEQYLLDLTGA